MERNTEKRASVLIVDAVPAVREALAIRISSQTDMKVCGESADVNDAWRLVAVAQPDVAVIDISLKTGNGINLIKRINDRNKYVRMIVWSMHSESLYAERALRAGAMGYITKYQATDKILEAIRRVLQGKFWLSEEMTESLLHRAASLRPQEVQRSRMDTLADRELEVFLLIGKGLKTADIAERMHLSIKTVETYRKRIREKLDLTDGCELSHFATKWVLVNELNGVDGRVGEEADARDCETLSSD